MPGIDGQSTRLADIPICASIAISLCFKVGTERNQIFILLRSQILERHSGRYSVRDSGGNGAVDRLPGLGAGAIKGGGLGLWAGPGRGFI